MGLSQRGVVDQATLTRTASAFGNAGYGRMTGHLGGLVPKLFYPARPPAKVFRGHPGSPAGLRPCIPTRPGQAILRCTSGNKDGVNVKIRLRCGSPISPFQAHRRRISRPDARDFLDYAYSDDRQHQTWHSFASSGLRSPSVASSDLPTTTDRRWAGPIMARSRLRNRSSRAGDLSRHSFDVWASSHL